MRILAIGGTGFVGRSAVQALQHHGHDVWTLARSPAEGRHLVGDRSRRGGLADAIAGRSWDAVVDLAAYQPREMQEAVEVFSGSLSRYVFVSSGVVYAGAAGSAEDGAPIPDGEPPSEELDYAEGKRWCEAVLARAIAAGFPGVVLRPPAVLGAEDHTGRIAGYLARVQDGGSMLALKGLADAEIGVAWSRDVGRVSAQLCEGVGAEFAYNVGFDRLTLRAFLDACAAALRVAPPVIVEVTAEELERSGLSLLDLSPYGPRRRTAGGWTIGRARAELNFEPSPLLPCSTSASRGFGSAVRRSTATSGAGRSWSWPSGSAVPAIRDRDAPDPVSIRSFADKATQHPALIPHEGAGSSQEYPPIPATPGSDSPGHGGNPR